jgi:sulfite reductase subunit B
MSILESKAYKIKKVITEASDNKTIVISCDLNPLPGQFVNVSIPGIGEAPISSASCYKNELYLNVRNVGSVTNTIHNMKPGDKIYLRGPYGNGYPMEQLKGKNLLLIGGGCGVAPLRGVLDYIDLHRKDYGEVHMFFGYRSTADVLFEDKLDHWQNNYKLHLSLDQAPKDNPFNCPVGFVTQILEAADFPKNSEALLCGPPIMINKSVSIIKEKGLNDQEIWVSLERHMKCCTGKCGHCMIHGKYVCTDGPVFRNDEVKNLDE